MDTAPKSQEASPPEEEIDPAKAVGAVAATLFHEDTAWPQMPNKTREDVMRSMHALIKLYPPPGMKFSIGGEEDNAEGKPETPES